MATETTFSTSGYSGDIRHKVRLYQISFEQGLYKRHEMMWRVPLDGFRLLFVGNTESHMWELSSVIHSMPPSVFVWVTCQERVFAQGISGDIWAKGGHLDRPPQSILGGLSCRTPIPPI